MPSNIPLPNKVEHMLMKISSIFPLDISNTHINIIFCHTLFYHISHFHAYTLNIIKTFQNTLLLPQETQENLPSAVTQETNRENKSLLNRGGLLLQSKQQRALNTCGNTLVWFP